LVKTRRYQGDDHAVALWQGLLDAILAASDREHMWLSRKYVNILEPPIAIAFLCF
jgi:hypothetical protein